MMYHFYFSNNFTSLTDAKRVSTEFLPLKSSPLESVEEKVGKYANIIM